MACLHSSVMWSGGQSCLLSSSEPRGSSIPSTAPPPPGSVAILMCHDDRQKVKGFLLKCDFWGFIPHLMRSGGARHVVATWHVLSGGFNAPLHVTLGFPTVFQFFVLNF